VTVDAQSVPTSPRILLAFDQAGSAVGAANEAIRRASEAGAEIVILSVVDSRNLRLPGGRVRRVDQERERLASGAQTIVRRAHDAGVRATYLVWVGDPAESILEASVAESADLILLGSRPRRNLRRLILGSVSSEVARRATCEVIVVPT
jgi:nucleotide-binding universal stress UspA family protein